MIQRVHISPVDFMAACFVNTVHETLRQPKKKKKTVPKTYWPTCPINTTLTCSFLGASGLAGGGLGVGSSSSSSSSSWPSSSSGPPLSARQLPPGSSSSGFTFSSHVSSALASVSPFSTAAQRNAGGVRYSSTFHSMNKVQLHIPSVNEVQLYICLCELSTALLRQYSTSVHFPPFLMQMQYKVLYYKYSTYSGTAESPLNTCDFDWGFQFSICFKNEWINELWSVEFSQY